VEFQVFLAEVIFAGATENDQDFFIELSKVQRRVQPLRHPLSTTAGTSA
jgi:hypothetical protein